MTSQVQALSTQKISVRTKLSGESESHSRTLLKCRDLIDISDEPEARGGTNEGLAPTEMALGALIACTNVITHKIAAKNDIDIVDISFDLDAQFNRLGVTLQEEVMVPFPEIVLNIELTSLANDEQLTILKSDLEKYCPVAKVFSSSGSKLTTNWSIKKPK